MAANWNAILSNANSMTDVLLILRKVLAGLDAKADLTTIDEAIAEISGMKGDIDSQIDYFNQVIKESVESGLYVPFDKQAELLNYKPASEPVVAKAFDTFKVWIWETRAPDTQPKWHDTGLSELDQANQHTNQAQDFLNQQTASKLSVQFDFQTKQILPSFFILNEHHKTIVPSDNSNQFNLDFFSSPGQQSLIFLDEEFKILNEQGGQDINFDDLPISEFNSKDVYLDSYFIKQIRKNYPAFYFNTSQATITHADDVYAFYDQMLHENPDYITKELLGNDTEGYPIYSYVFTPPEKLYWGHSKSSVEPPLFVITAGIHGAEKMGIIAVISFFLNLVNEWRTEQHYDKLRFACKFVVVPACNPYGIKANTRGNINGVDLNRNFDSNWGESGSNDPSNVGYRGPSAFSETESRLLATIPDKYPNATLFLDIHQQGEIYLFWFGTILDSTKGIVVDSLDEMITFVHKQIKPNANLQLQMGRIGYNGPGTLAQYFQLVKEVPTILIEASSSNHPMLTGQWLHARVVAEKSILTVIHKTYEKEVRQRSISLI